jgi:peptidyl-prolyl cis-trans isomerase D
MALIGKIRKNMWLVILLVAVSLAGFILQDMTNGNSSGLFNSNTTVGKIGGEKIDILDFQKTEQALYSGGNDPYASKNSVWNYYVENAIVSKIADQSGIGVGADELAELEFGNNLSPIVRSMYGNPQTGQVDREQLNSIKKAIDEGSELRPEFVNSFTEMRKQVIKQAKQTKLDNMVSKAMYTPTWLAETMDKINNESASFEYVSIPFTVVPDTDVKLTDDDYAKYIKKYAARYTNKEEVRNVSFVSFDVKPTVEDSAKILSEITAIGEKFRTATNDSLFASTNGGFYSNNYSKKDDIIGVLKDNITNLAVGSTYGPYKESGSYVIAKLLGKKVMADSASASHILRSVTNGDPAQLAAANKYIDSLRNLIETGAKSFTDCATSYSQDQASAVKGGDLGTFAPGQMVGPFNDAVFNGKTGGIYKVTTQFGVHLIKVGKQVYKGNDLKYKLAYVTKPIVASDLTQDAISDKVLAILEKTKTIDELSKVVTGDLKLEVAGGLKKNDFVVGTLGSGEASREIVKWAFENSTKIGDVSSVAHAYKEQGKFVNSRYVIAALKSINPAGLATVEAVKTSIEAQVKAAKKAEIIKSRIAGSDFTSIAAAFGVTPAVAENVTLNNPTLKEGASEPVVVAKSLSLNPGTVSKPIDGNSGVYVTKLTAKTPASVEKGSMNQKMMMTQMTRGQVNYKLMESLKKSAKIDDNRSSLY